MKVLVTGGAGFIGSHVIDALRADGHTAVVIDNLSSGDKRNVPKGVKFYKVSLTDPTLDRILKKEKVDAVCHLAAKTNMRESLENPYADLETNVLGLVHLLELVTKKYPVKKFVFSSTGGALYGASKDFPVYEESATNPTSPYGVTKLAGERYLYYYHAVHDLPVVILRYSNVYGPRNERKKHRGAVTVFVDRVMKGEPIVVNGDGSQTRDFVYVKDIASANLKALTSRSAGYRVYNVSGGVEMSVNGMVGLIERYTGKKAQIIHRSAIRGEVTRSKLSNRKIRRELQWVPRYSIAHGIKELVTYLQRVSL